MNTTTLSNSFHNTNVQVRLPETFSTQREAFRALLELADVHPGYQAKLVRVRRKLCGVRGCTCGTVR